MNPPIQKPLETPVARVWVPLGAQSSQGGLGHLAPCSVGCGCPASPGLPREGQAHRERLWCTPASCISWLPPGSPYFKGLVAQGWMKCRSFCSMLGHQ